MVSFLPLPPPLKTGEKRRKNAKPKPVKGIIYAHEDQSLSQFLDAIINSIDEAHNLTFSIANRSGLLDTDCFTLEYTINRSDSKDIAIRNTADYKTLIEEILTLNRPASLFKVQITEQKVSSPVLRRICRLKKHVGSFRYKERTTTSCRKKKKKEQQPKRRCVY
jgi:hypothetical protein